MTLAEKMREVYRRQDPQAAAEVADFCRARGWTYAHVVRAFGNSNGLDEKEAGAEWEEIIKEEESW